MKIFFAEYKADYPHYRFPYQVWLLKEEGDSPENIYGAGFLPIRSLPGIYYLSRSLRINLAAFELSSENRRILKKTDCFESDLMPLSEFVYRPKIQKFCKDYMRQKFGKGSMTAAGIRKIFTGITFNYIFVWKERETQKEIGYAVCFVSSKIVQYAHAFYDLKYFQQSLGGRMMLEAVNWAKESKKEYLYLGTCYEESALYKTEFKGVEFFNGFRWSDNLEELKGLILRNKNREAGSGDKEGKKEEEYTLKNKDFLEKYYQGDLRSILDRFGIKVSF